MSEKITIYHRKKCNILIEPNLEGFSTGSFHDSPAILQRGMEAGKAYYEIFKHLADSIKQIGPLHKVVKPAIQESYIFDKIEIVGNEVITNDFITGKMKFKPGKELSIKELNKRIEMTYGTQYFDRITYEIHGEPGHRTLKLNVVERPNIQFRFSFFYDYPANQQLSAVKSEAHEVIFERITQDIFNASLADW